jgi:ParB family transcriptional regulator, chromosome partitioning protein
MSKRDDLGKGVLEDLAALRAKGSVASILPVRRVDPVPKTIAAEMSEGYIQTIARLKAERENGRVVLELDPKQVRFSSIANRHERSLKTADEDFKALKADLLEHGQEYPIKVKAVTDDPEHPFEVVAGHRRLAACRELDATEAGGFPVYAVLDAQARELKKHALKMYRENAIRKDLSAYETGRMFRRWLEEKLFVTQQDLAAAVHLDPATVSQYLSVADLPTEVLHAFGDPRVVSLRWMQALSPALKSSRAAVLAAAARIARQSPRPLPDAVLAELATAGKTGKRRGGPEAETVKIGGKSLYTISWKGSRVSLKFGKQVDGEVVGEAQEALKQFLTSWLKKKVKP